MSQAYGIYDLSRTTTRESDGKLEGPAATKRGAVTADLWAGHLAGKIGIGIVPIREDNTCFFGAIDIDVYSGINHADIASQLARLQIPMAVCRSKSGGAHVYLFSSEPVDAAKFQAKLREIAAYLGYGGSEIFPKQTRILVEEGDVGQWINMPYFNGVRGMRFCVNQVGDALSAAEFLLYVDTIKQDVGWFNRPMVVPNDFPDGPPCLQILANIGYPKGVRNDGLYNIGVYLKKADPDNWESQIEAMNHKFMMPPLELAGVQGVMKSLKKKDYNYTCTKQPICNHCNATLCRTRKFGVSGGQGRFPSLGGLTKLTTKPPIWFWTVDGVRMELATADIQDPRSFQRKCMEFLNQMPPVPSNPVWQAAVQHAMDSVTIVEAPEDASPEGQFWDMVERFCTARAQAQEKEEIITGKPFTNGTRTYFRISDLVMFLQRHKFSEFGTTKIASILREHGAEHHASNFKGRNVNYWSIPSFSLQNKPLDVPKTIVPDKDVF